MPNNKTQIDRIHDLMPKLFKTRTNPNWKALIEAIGQQDQEAAELIQEVRKQFFISTSSRPYLDRLGTNVKVARPKFVGMDDATFRNFIPVVAYQPKQVKLVMDLLLDIFFDRDSTTAFTQSIASEPFALEDGFDLEYLVDATTTERVTFNTEDFVNIAAATADEVAAVINRNVTNSFAVVFDDRIQQKKFVRIFTTTIGSKGSVQIVGGLANIALQLQGFNITAGSDNNTVWAITKSGETMTFTHIDGGSPGLDQVKLADIALIDIPDNRGSFEITELSVSDNSFSFINTLGTGTTFDFDPADVSTVGDTIAETAHGLSTNDTVRLTTTGTLPTGLSPATTYFVVSPAANTFQLSATLSGPAIDITGIGTGVHTLTTVHDHAISVDSTVQFLTPEKIVVFNKDSRAVVWEVQPGQIIVEIPASPPVVKRELIGAAHINGLVSNVTSRDSSTALTVADATDFPTSGQFVLQEEKEILTHHLTTSEDITLAYNFSSRFDKKNSFTYTGKTGNQLTGITPDVPAVAGLFERTIVSANRDASNIVTVTTTAAHGFNVGEGVRIQNTVPTVSGTPSINLTVPVDGTFIILSAPTTTTFTYQSAGDEGESTGGVARVERIGMSNTDSQVFITSAELDTGITGPYVWDLNASFVLSSLTASLQDEINAGNTVRSLDISTPNAIPNEEGFVIFDFGTERQEGPVRYLFKPTDSSIQMDPAFVFQFNHAVGSSITAIRRRGAHVMSGKGTEYPPYITDPGVARTTLQDLIREVKSVGIFIEFLVRFPPQLYATLDVYGSGDPTLHPVSQ